MITQARIHADVKPAGFDWITALRAPAIQALAAEGGPLHPRVTAVTARGRSSTSATWRKSPRTTTPASGSSSAVTRSWPPSARASAASSSPRPKKSQGSGGDAAQARATAWAKDKIGLKVGAVINRRHMAKHFELAIADTSFAFSRKTEAIAAEAALDGVYVIRSSLPSDGFPAAAIVLAYKGLSHAERGFRGIKSGDLDVRPIHHRRAHRGARSRLPLHARLLRCLAHEARSRPDAVQGRRSDRRGRPASLAGRQGQSLSRGAPKGRAQAPADGQPVHSFRTLLQDLANLTRNSVRFGDAPPTTLLARPTPIQTRAFQLLSVKIAA